MSSRWLAAGALALLAAWGLWDGGAEAPAGERAERALERTVELPRAVSAPPRLAPQLRPARAVPALVEAVVPGHRTAPFSEGPPATEKPAAIPREAGVPPVPSPDPQPDRAASFDSERSTRLVRRMLALYSELDAEP